MTNGQFLPNRIGRCLPVIVQEAAGDTGLVAVFALGQSAVASLLPLVTSRARRSSVGCCKRGRHGEENTQLQIETGDKIPQ